MNVLYLDEVDLSIAAPDEGRVGAGGYARELGVQAEGRRRAAHCLLVPRKRKDMAT